MSASSRILAASARRDGSVVSVALTTEANRRRRVQRLTCSPVDAMALATMLQMAVARGPSSFKKAS